MIRKRLLNSSFNLEEQQSEQSSYDRSHSTHYDIPYNDKQQEHKQASLYSEFLVSPMST